MGRLTGSEESDREADRDPEPAPEKKSNVWIWNYTAPEKLTPELVRELKSLDSQRYLSPESIWEMAVVLEKKRVNLKQVFRALFNNSVEDLGLPEAPVH